MASKNSLVNYHKFAAGIVVCKATRALNIKMIRVNWIIATFLSCCLCTWGCTYNSYSRVPSDAIRLRTTTQFDTVNLFKPKHPKKTDSLGFDIYMAPLIIQNAPNGVSRETVDRFGVVSVDSSGRLYVDTARPAVYYSLASVVINGRVYPQISYLWFYDSGYTERSVSNTQITVQGIRMTMDGDGFPGIIEVLTDSSNMDIFYVSTTLEETAVDVFGKPLPGRRYSVEHSKDVSPNSVVARILKNGPEPSGPFVYLQSISHDITTLLCRCEDVQFWDIGEDVIYELLPIEELKKAGISVTIWSKDILSNKPLLSIMAMDWLEKVLRLPPDF